MRPHRWQPTRLPRPWDSPGKNTGVGCHFLLQCMKVKSESEVAQSCPTLSNPMDCSLPGSSIHGIFQARILEWGTVGQNHLTETLFYIKCWIYHAIYRIRYWKWKTYWLYVPQGGCNGTGWLPQWWSGWLGAVAQWAASIIRNCHTTYHLLRKKKKSKFKVWSLLDMHHFCIITIIKLTNQKLGIACKLNYF